MMCHSPLRTPHMLKNLDAASEAPRAMYERLLQRSIRLHQEFNTLGRTIAAVSRTNEHRAEELLTTHRESSLLVDQLARERIALIKLVERLSNRNDTMQQYVADASIATIVATFSSEPGGFTSTLNEDVAEFGDAAIARTHGYHVDQIDEWLVLEKDTIEIHLVMSREPRSRNVGGESRVAQIAVYDRGHRVLFFDGEWVQACIDTVTQREVDSLLAVLG